VLKNNKDLTDKTRIKNCTKSKDINNISPLQISGIGVASNYMQLKWRRE
jgi:hypothetical protein